jgi:hypothetical protein
MYVFTIVTSVHLRGQTVTSKWNLFAKSLCFHLNYFFIDEAQEAEAIQVIHAMLDIREQQSVQSPSIMFKIYFTVAMLQFVLGDMTKVR